jgi:uncharacterized protein (TIGR02145 family)
MFCNQCHKNLKDFEALLDKMENCPFCGAKLVRPAVKVPQKGVNDLFDTLLQKVGEGLFVDDSVLENELRNLEAPEFEDAKDRLFLLVLKHIPSSMSAVKDFSDGEQQEVIEACLKRLCVDLGMSFEPCAQMLDALQTYIWKKIFPLSQNFFEGHFVDPRDGQVYKTVKIGDQVWMKEPLKYKCVGYCGEGLYEWNSVNKYCAVRGWRVPKKKDFEKLVQTASNLGLGDASSVLMSRNGWEKCSVTPTDNLGFEATPVKGNTGGIGSNYYSHFWTADDKYCFEIFPGRISFSTHSQSYVRLIKDDTAENKE